MSGTQIWIGRKPCSRSRLRWALTLSRDDFGRVLALMICPRKVTCNLPRIPFSGKLRGGVLLENCEAYDPAQTGMMGSHFEKREVTHPSYYVDFFAREPFADNARRDWMSVRRTMDLRHASVKERERQLSLYPNSSQGRLQL